MNNCLKRLDEICNITISSVDKKNRPNEKSVKLCNFTDVYYNWVIYPNTTKSFMKATTSEKNISLFSLKQGDVCITKDSETRNDIGMATYIAEKIENVVLGYHCALIRPKIGLNGAYLSLYLRSYLGRKYFENQASGSGQRYTLAKESIGAIKIRVPNFSFQNAIADLFLNIDKKISINKLINDNLQQQLKLLYDHWFTQFDFPDEKGMPYKSSGGLMLAKDKISYNIPADWTVCNLFNNPLTTVIKPGVDIFDKKRYLATAEVNGTDISTGTLIEYENRESRANMQPTVNSVWFAKMKNSIKHLYLDKEMDELVNNSILSTGFCGLQCSEDTFEYVASFIEHSYFETLKDTLAHGATQEAVNNDDLTGVSFVIPSERVLHLFHERTQSIYSQISKNICENQELTQLRDWLLTMLMNGQATISD